MIKKSITVTPQQNDWIKNQVSDGRYGSDSELFRDLIRREQERTARDESIRMALVDGELSGLSHRTPEEIKRSVMGKT